MTTPGWPHRPHPATMDPMTPPSFPHPVLHPAVVTRIRYTVGIIATSVWLAVAERLVPPFTWPTPPGPRDPGL